jgi:8-oxo-dGTP pyrophosphatase MutT (NUDIX family)
MINPRDFKLISDGDESLAPVPSLRLNSAFLRSQFILTPTWQPEVVSDRMRPIGATLTPAAVLLPVLENTAGELSMLLTLRTEKLKKHSGQIAFPGGKVDPTDENPTAAALREAEEEVGLSAQQVEVLGTLPLYETGTGFAVTPVVGLVQEGFEMRLSEDEVAEAFTVPITFLMNPRFHQRRSFEWESRQREFFAMPYPRQASAENQHSDYFIWGATAAMIRNLYRFWSA